MINKVVFTGPESSGKSTLAKLCSEKLNLPLITELARFNPDVVKRTISAQTVSNLAEQTIHQEKNALKQHPFIICDTSLLVLYVWLKVKFKVESSSIKAIILNTKSTTFYFLCKPDIPWEYDALREDPNTRDELFNLYIDLCISWELKYFIVHGDYYKRTHLTFQQLEVLTPR